MRWLPPSADKHPNGSARRDWRVYALGLFFLDIASAVGALVVSYYLRFGIAREAFNRSDVSLDRYIMLGAAVLAAWPIAARGFGLYEKERLLGGTDEYSRVVQASTLLLLGAILVDFIVASNVVSRGWLVLFWISLVVLDGSGRFLARRVAYAARRRGAFSSRMIIVGADDRAVELARHLSGPGFAVLGFLDDFRPVGSPVGGNGWRALGPASHLARAEELGADEVIIVPSAISWESRQKVLNLPQRRRVAVRVLATREGALTGGVTMTQRACVPVYTLEKARVSGLEAAIKGAFDIAVALALVAAVGPFAVFRLVRRGAQRQPLLERHRLVGMNGDPITVYSLAGGGSRMVSKLPAVASVLRGQMSIVGPPPLEQGQEAETPELRLMKPGLTSVVRADHGHLDHESAVSLQLDYVRRYSIWRDLQIIWHRLLSSLPRAHRDAFQRDARGDSLRTTVELWR